MFNGLNSGLNGVAASGLIVVQLLLQAGDDKVLLVTVALDCQSPVTDGDGGGGFTGACYEDGIVNSRQLDSDSITGQGDDSVPIDGIVDGDDAILGDVDSLRFDDATGGEGKDGCDGDEVSHGVVKNKAPRDKWRLGWKRTEGNYLASATV